MTPPTPFMKHDHGKPRMDLLPPEALIEVSRVLGYGANKYAAHNWRKATEWGRYSAAAMRHLTAWMNGEDVDPESGLPHVAHATCCLMFLLALQQTGVGTDDRYKPTAERSEARE
jgi:hypothetical protein